MLPPTDVYGWALGTGWCYQPVPKAHPWVTSKEKYLSSHQKWCVGEMVRKIHARQEILCSNPAQPLLPKNNSHRQPVSEYRFKNRYLSPSPTGAYGHFSSSGLSWYDLPFSMSSSIMMEYEFALLVTGKGMNSPPRGRSLPDPWRWILDSLCQTPLKNSESCKSSTSRFSSASATNLSSTENVLFVPIYKMV